MSSMFAPFVSEKTKADSIHASSLYYQYKPEQLPACPLMIHALLHIPDQIRWMGPCWTTWAFPIERQCGVLSMQHPEPMKPICEHGPTPYRSVTAPANQNFIQPYQ